ncbi:MAG: hypothetical protein HKO57_15840, partial [Akkermansiaceae bacterium]|nr:hypothetical protein [Akkermansiaceae bacterium]
QAVPGLDISPLETIGIAGAAWLIGFWAIGVPGGIGVREGALAWLLAHSGSLEAGMAVAVLWRALQVVVELAALGTAALTRAIPARRERREFGVLRVFNF